MARLTETVRRALMEERQTQILAAAMKVFAKKGFERATIKDIAKEADIAEGSIYNYFKNKDDLLAHVPHILMQSALQTLDPLLEAPSSELAPEQALTQIAHFIIGFFHGNVAFFRVLFSSLPSMGVATRRSFVEQGILYASGQLEVVFEHLVAQGVFRSDLNPKIAPRMFFGLLMPTILLREIIQVPDPAGVDYEAVIANAVMIFLHGTLAPEPTTPTRGVEKSAARSK